MFHFNKKHLEDPAIPMWVLKTKGESYYVHHVDCNMSWSTKETPDNSHTKGSLKVKDCLLVIDDAAPHLLQFHANTSIIAHFAQDYPLFLSTEDDILCISQQKIFKNDKISE